MFSGFRLGSDSGSHPGNENCQDGREECRQGIYSPDTFPVSCLGLLYPVKKGCWSSQGGLFYLTIPIGFLLFVSPLSLWPHWLGYMITTSSRLPLSLVALLYSHFHKSILSNKLPLECATCCLLAPWLRHRGSLSTFCHQLGGSSIRMAAVALPWLWPSSSSFFCSLSICKIYL